MKGEEEQAKRFSSRLKALRNEQGFSQENLAKVLDVDSSTIAKYEGGMMFPKMSKVLTLAQTFNVSIDYLLGRSSARNNPEWYEKLPPEIQEMVCEHNLKYLEVGLIAKAKGWDKEAIEELTSAIERLSKRREGNGKETTKTT